MNRNYSSPLRLPLTLVCLLAAPIALSQQTLAVTPMKGQTPEQVKTDTTECQASGNAAGSSTAQATAPTSPPPAGGRARGAMAGAAAGATAAEIRGQSHAGYDRLPEGAKQEYRQQQAREGAAVGAVAGGMNQRHQRRQAAAQSAQSQEAASNAYNQAFVTCMQGRGYSAGP